MSVQKTLGVKSDAAILSDLQSLGLTVNVTAFSSTAGLPPFSISFDNEPAQADLDAIQTYFGGDQGFSWS